MLDSAEQVPQWRVWGVRLGSGARPTRDNFLRPGERPGVTQIDFISWIAVHGDQVVVIDTGFSVTAGAHRGRTLEIGPAQAIRLLGLEPDAVGHVILTHLHFDHAGNLDDFPEVVAVVQEAEMSYVTGPDMRHDLLRHFYEGDDIARLVSRLFAGQVDVISGDVELLPGLQLVLVGGHTRGTQVVRVHTERGWVVLAGDAIHYFENLSGRDPFPAVLDVALVLDGYDKIESLADSQEHIIPGHDPEIFRLYELVPHTEGTPIVALHRAPNPSRRSTTNE